MGHLNGCGANSAADVERPLTRLQLSQVEELLGRPAAPWMDNPFSKYGQDGIRVQRPDVEFRMGPRSCHIMNSFSDGDNRKTRRLPFGQSVLEPPGPKTGLPQDPDRLVGKGAIRPPAVRHDFLVAGELAKSAAKFGERK
jgi:hypothetical protein